MELIKENNVMRVWTRKDTIKKGDMSSIMPDTGNPLIECMLENAINRYVHIFYVQVNECTMLGVAYKFMKDETTRIIYGACIIRYDRKASPPKRCIRQTALARLQKCPVGLQVGLAEMTPFTRRHVIRECIHHCGVSGVRFVSPSPLV